MQLYDKSNSIVCKVRNFSSKYLLQQSDNVNMITHLKIRVCNFLNKKKLLKLIKNTPDLQLL